MAALSALAIGCASDEGAERDTADGAGQADSSTTDTGTEPIEDVDQGGEGAEDSATADASCFPSCLDKQCGSDGCGGACGTCAPGTVCSGLGVCEAPPGDVPFGGFCGVTPTCGPTVLDDTGATAPNPFWPACLNSQCESGLCNQPYCTQACTLVADEINNGTGQLGSDGVEDPEYTSCSGAIDGPVGTAFRCVNFAPGGSAPVGFCAAGTTFAPCVSNSECPSGEVCELLAVLGESLPRCTAQVRPSLAVGAQCEGEGAASPEEMCAAAGLCTGSGCTALCASDGECLSEGATCTDGACAGAPGVSCGEDADCTAWVCGALGPAPGGVDAQLCVPRGCNANADCRDDSFRCRPRPAGGGSEAVAWAHQCLAVPANASLTAGEACSNASPATNGCDNPDLCYKGQCSALCTTDADCPTDAQQVCAVADVPVDPSGDGVVDAILPLSLCEPLTHAGVLTACERDSDCVQPGEVCAPIARKNEEGALFAYRIEQFCRAPGAGFGSYGDPCGNTPGSGECGVGFCTFDDLGGGVPPICSEVCSSHEDCGEVNIGEGNQPSVCRAVRYGTAGTAAPQDDLYVPICWPTYSGSSKNPCSVSKPCEDENEVCLPFATTRGPDAGGQVEYLCIRHPAKRDAGSLGDSCTGPTDCKSLICLPAAEGQGYCGGLCDQTKGDLDCVSGGPFMVCDAHVAVDRTVTQFDVVVPQCRKAQSCTPCARNADCTEGMVCIRVGGAPVCAWTCDGNDDCANKDGGPGCQETESVESPGVSLEVCRPLSCSSLGD